VSGCSKKSLNLNIMVSEFGDLAGFKIGSLNNLTGFALRTSNM
jgi:hypothetical protein